MNCQFLIMARVSLTNDLSVNSLDLNFVYLYPRECDWLLQGTISIKCSNIFSIGRTQLHPCSIVLVIMERSHPPSIVSV
jgi:hypothetical protein